MRTPVTGCLLSFLLVFASACTVPESDEGRAPDIRYPDSTLMGLPFSDAVRVDHMLYLSGQIGVLPGTLELVEGGIQEQTRQTMENIKATLEKYDSSMSEVVKCTVMIADMSEWGAMNEVYTTYFPEHKPARSAIGANGLALNAAVEIECLASVE